MDEVKRGRGRPTKYVGMPRNKRLCIRCSERCDEQIDWLVEKTGRNKSDVIEDAITAYYLKKKFDIDY